VKQVLPQKDAGLTEFNFMSDINYNNFTGEYQDKPFNACDYNKSVKKSSKKDNKKKSNKSKK
jgi:hypothetical protein